MARIYQLQSSETNDMCLNAGIRHKTSCTESVSTLPYGSQIIVYSTSEHSTTWRSDHRAFYQSAHYHTVVRSSCIPPVNTVPHGGQIIVYSTSEHSITRWSDRKLVKHQLTNREALPMAVGKDSSVWNAFFLNRTTLSCTRQDSISWLFASMPVFVHLFSNGLVSERYTVRSSLSRVITCCHLFSRSEVLHPESSITRTHSLLGCERDTHNQRLTWLFIHKFTDPWHWINNRPEQWAEREFRFYDRYVQKISWARKRETTQCSTAKLNQPRINTQGS